MGERASLTPAIQTGRDATSRSADPEALGRLIAAARECFARDGVSKTRMAAVAQAAGMVRQTVYAFVSSREELIELAFAQRLRELKPTIEAQLGSPAGDPAGALVECCIVMTAVARGDREFNEYATALGLSEALRFLTGPFAPQTIVAELVRPIYASAAADGLLRSDVSLDDMAWWIRNVLAPLWVRADVDSSELRSILEKFALPALLTTR